MPRILKRPMFRTGGTPNEGIMHGLVNRKGYNLGTRTEEIVAAMDKYAPIPKSRFPLGQIGLNLVSGEFGGEGFLQNVAGSMRNPYSQWTAADDARSQALAKRKASAVGVAISEESAREMQMLKNLSKDERILLEKQAQLLVDQKLAPDFQSALRSLIYKKKEDPGMSRTRRIEERTKNYTSGSFPDSHPIATAKATFDIDRSTIIANNPDLQFDPVNPFIDVTGKQSSYNEGFVYFNPADGQYYHYNGIVDGQPDFDPVEVNS